MFVFAAGCANIFGLEPPRTRTLDDARPADSAQEMDGSVDSGSDAAPNMITVTPLGNSVTSVSGSSVTLTLTQSVPAGSFVIVQTAGRGETSISVSDSKSNTWTRAVETANSSATSAVGIFSSVLVVALGSGETITATWLGGGNSYERAIGALRVSGVTTLDQTGSAQVGNTFTPSVSTSGAVANGSELVIAVISTGFNNSDTFAPGGAFTENFEYGGNFSSGALNYLVGVNLSGVQTFSPTTGQNAAEYALAIATFR